MSNNAADTRQSRLPALLIVVIVILGLIAVALFLAQKTSSQFAIPKNIAERVLFPVYVPKTLPGGYRITGEPEVAEGVLFFHATNESGHSISFSEQAYPKNFDFSAFHSRTLKDSKSIQDAPFPSILGESERKTMLLSVTTGQTWIIVTSQAPDAASSLESIARHIKKQ